MRTDRGFSLTELLVVLLLFGLIVAVGIPAFSRIIPALELEGSASELASEIASARLRAIERRTNTTVSSDTPTSYRVNPWRIERRFARSVSATSFPDVTFDTRGLLASGASATIVLASRAGTRTLTVSAAGRVRVRS